MLDLWGVGFAELRSCSVGRALPVGHGGDAQQSALEAANYFPEAVPLFLAWVRDLTARPCLPGLRVGDEP
jgi:hypothetical protein